MSNHSFFKDEQADDWMMAGHTSNRKRAETYSGETMMPTVFSVTDSPQPLMGAAKAVGHTDARSRSVSTSSFSSRPPVFSASSSPASSFATFQGRQRLSSFNPWGGSPDFNEANATARAFADPLGFPDTMRPNPLMDSLSAFASPNVPAGSLMPQQAPYHSLHKRFAQYDEDFVRNSFSLPSTPKPRTRALSALPTSLQSLNITDFGYADVAGRPRSNTFGIAEADLERQMSQLLVREDGVQDYNDLPQSLFVKAEDFSASHITLEEKYEPAGPSMDQSPSRSIWIGNFDTSISTHDIVKLFAPFGAIESVRILRDKDCAFVNYEQQDAAVKAKEAMQGAMIGRTVIRIGFGKPDTMHDPNDFQPTKSIWLGNLPSDLDLHQIKHVFSQFGPIESVRVLSHKNCGFVNFVHLSDAMRARDEMAGWHVQGSDVKVGYAKVPRLSDASNQSSMTMEQTPQLVSDARTPRQSFTSETALPVMPEAVAPFADISPLSHADASFADHFNPETDYATGIPALPEASVVRHVEVQRLREMRKKLEGLCTAADVERMYNECYSDMVDLATDHLGNVVLQRIMEKGADHIKLGLIQKLAPHMASIGIHKNGTWVVQKIIDTARTPAQMQCIVHALRPYTPALLLDQFGNYVVQGCLRMGPDFNQFVFDAMYHRCIELGFGRFGARSMRTCLTSPYTTKRQQKHVAQAVIANAVQLCMNQNGNILINWLMDTSNLPGRYRALMPTIKSALLSLATHKLASPLVFKMITQRSEMDARQELLQELIFRNDTVLRGVLADRTMGVTLLHRILTTPQACVSNDERMHIAAKLRQMIADTPSLNSRMISEELEHIPALPDHRDEEASLSPLVKSA